VRKSILIAVAASLLAFGPMALAQDPLADHPHLKDGGSLLLRQLAHCGRLTTARPNSVAIANAQSNC